MGNAPGFVVCRNIPGFRQHRGRLFLERVVPRQAGQQQVDSLGGIGVFRHQWIEGLGFLGIGTHQDAAISARLAWGDFHIGGQRVVGPFHLGRRRTGAGQQ